MSDSSKDIFKFSPYKLIAPFAETRFWRNLLIGVVLHIFVIGLFSIGYLKAQITGEEPVEDVVEAPADQPADPQPASSAPAQSPGNGEVSQPDANAVDDGVRGTSVIEQRLRETASPDEIPGEPDLGIGLDDTNID